MSKSQHSQKANAPEIFDQRLITLRRERAIRRGGLNFLHKRCAEDAVERVCDINRRFDKALIIGLPETRHFFLQSLPADKTPKGMIECDALAEDLDIEAGHVDLVISLLHLHNINDLPGALFQLKQVLKTDGLFIGAVFGGETLKPLRHVLYGLDDKHLGGITARVSPFADYSQLAGLLQRTGYAQPVVDKDRVTVSYTKGETLINDLRDMGETNSLTSRETRYIGKAYYEDIISQFEERNPFEVNFEILWMTGWSPHESQQKPLKPGSAQISLTQVLKDKS